MTLFKDKVVIVTGAASGIGKALCQQLSTKQAIIFITDIDLIQCQQLAIQITQSGGRAVAAKLDVSNLLEFEQLILSVCQQHQKLDYIFNNAGIGIAAEVQDMQIEDWQNIVNINLWGVINGTTTAYKIMVKQGFGHIVNIASLAGLIGSPTMTAYATTKSAIIGLSNSLRMEAKSLGVKVSVVCPGFIQTSI
ncbi:MAG: SDR family oxidoreductase, partial [Blastocatellia bacterium]|nr:SDR family oxidoreductase [Blastocatellia bacterium]